MAFVDTDDPTRRQTPVLRGLRGLESFIGSLEDDLASTKRSSTSTIEKLLAAASAVGALALGKSSPLSAGFLSGVTQGIASRSAAEDAENLERRQMIEKAILDLNKVQQSQAFSQAQQEDRQAHDAELEKLRQEGRITRDKTTFERGAPARELANEFARRRVEATEGQLEVSRGNLAVSRGRESRLSTDAKESKAKKLPLVVKDAVSALPKHLLRQDRLEQQISKLKSQFEGKALTDVLKNSADVQKLKNEAEEAMLPLAAMANAYGLGIDDVVLTVELLRRGEFTDDELSRALDRLRQGMFTRSEFYHMFLLNSDDVPRQGGTAGMTGGL